MFFRNIVGIFKINFYSVPLKLHGENHYSLTAVKNVKITNSFMTLDQSVRKCQIEEKLYECTSRKYLDLVYDTCGCVPFSIKNFTVNKVYHISNKIISSLNAFFPFRNPHVTEME